MAEYVRMPQKGLTEESALLSAWYKKEGEVVRKGELLFALETGKAVFDVEAETDGVVLKIIHEAGEEVKVGEMVCIIGDATKESPSVSEPESVSATASLSVPPPLLESRGSQTFNIFTTPLQDSRPSIYSKRPAASPRARKTAKELGISLEGIRGSGPGGRILEEDVRAFLSSLPHLAGQSGTLYPNASYYLFTAFDATELLDFQERYNRRFESSNKRLSVKALLAFAVSRVLRDFPNLNALGSSGEPSSAKAVHLGVEVITDQGLFHPVVHNIETKGLLVIEEEIQDKSRRCREGTIRTEELEGATFTLSNLEGRSIECLALTLNPPQVATLSIGNMEYKRKQRDDGFIDYPSIGLYLTVDSRVVQKVTAMQFLEILSTKLEKFHLLLAEG